MTARPALRGAGDAVTPAAGDPAAGAGMRWPRRYVFAALAALPVDLQAEAEDVAGALMARGAAWPGCEETALIRVTRRALEAGRKLPPPAVDVATARTLPPLERVPDRQPSPPPPPPQPPAAAAQRLPLTAGPAPAIPRTRTW